MTGSKCLLDTSVIIQAFRKDNTVVHQLDKLAEVFVPVIVVGELVYGAHKSSNLRRNIEQ
jgi:tRNA(fMet)-specific endonuclease VapC